MLAVLQGSWATADDAEPFQLLLILRLLLSAHLSLLLLLRLPLFSLPIHPLCHSLLLLLLFSSYACSHFSSPSLSLFLTSPLMFPFSFLLPDVLAFFVLSSLPPSLLLFSHCPSLPLILIYSPNSLILSSSSSLAPSLLPAALTPPLLHSSSLSPSSAVFY